MRFTKRFWLQIVMMTCFFIADQATKYAFYGRRAFDGAGSLIWVQTVLNRGLAFSLPVWSWLALALNAGVLLALIWYWLLRLDVSVRESWFLAVVLGGAFGNIVDRLFYKGVVDWIQINWFGLSQSSINLADLFIIAGALGWLWERSSIAKSEVATLKEGEK